MLGPTLSELGELAVLQRLRPFCAADIGDDASLRRVPTGSDLVVSSDTLVDGVHFSDRTTPPLSVGWRAAAVNLSDLAAMAAQPLGVTVAAALPPETPWPWLEAVYQGLADCLCRYGSEILGGDLTRSQVKTLSVTALGTVVPESAIFRHTAQPGQAILVTGPHGAARAGLALLLGELEGDQLVPALAQQWIRAHQFPQPRFDAIATLQTLAQRQRICLRKQVAGMDSSDGLANAVVQLCRQSGVGGQVLRSHLPIAPGLTAAVGPTQAQHWTLYGGEDFELVLCLPWPLATAITQTLEHCTIIGETTVTQKIELIDPNQVSAIGTEIDLGQAYQHF